MRPVHRLVTLFMLLPALAGAATCTDPSIPPSNPDTIYTDHGDGTVTDTRTGLTWKRCAEGMSWNGSTCTGSSLTYTWDAALALAESVSYAGHDDWRLPNLKELRNLVEECRLQPTINETLFPGFSGAVYWSGTPATLNWSSPEISDEAWNVNFGSGYSAFGSRAYTYRVLLVRGGHSLAAFDLLANPTPSAFDIADLSNQPLATVVTTGAITVAGLGTVVPATTSVGTIVKNGSDTGQPSTTVVNGDTLAVRLITSASYGTPLTGTLTIGSGATASDDFSVTTLPAPVIHGVCGSVAPTSFKPAGVCASGTLNAAGVIPGPNLWAWACDGSGGGTSTPPNACSTPWGQTATGSGPASVDASSGWAFAPSGTDASHSSGFIPTSGHPKSPPNLPEGFDFPHGLLDFVLSGGTPGSAATLTITYPSPIPPDAVYWKYGPSPDGYDCAGADCATPHWYRMPAPQVAIAGNTLTLTLHDGGVGDDDLDAGNGVIVDVGGLGVSNGAGGPGINGVPTASAWALLLLCLLIGGLGLRHTAPTTTPKAAPAPERPDPRALHC